jgi:hypothetical protein
MQRMSNTHHLTDQTIIATIERALADGRDWCAFTVKGEAFVSTALADMIGPRTPGTYIGPPADWVALTGPCGTCHGERCDIDWCVDCGDEYTDPCPRHRGGHGASEGTAQCDDGCCLTCGGDGRKRVTFTRPTPLWGHDAIGHGPDLGVPLVSAAVEVLPVVEPRADPPHDHATLGWDEHGERVLRLWRYAPQGDRRIWRPWRPQGDGAATVVVPQRIPTPGQDFVILLDRMVAL